MQVDEAGCRCPRAASSLGPSLAPLGAPQDSDPRSILLGHLSITSQTAYRPGVFCGDLYSVARRKMKLLNGYQRGRRSPIEEASFGRSPSIGCTLHMFAGVRILRSRRFVLAERPPCYTCVTMYVIFVLFKDTNSPIRF